MIVSNLEKLQETSIPLYAICIGLRSEMISRLRSFDITVNVLLMK